MGQRIRMNRDKEGDSCIMADIIIILSALGPPLHAVAILVITVHRRLKFSYNCRHIHSLLNHLSPPACHDAMILSFFICSVVDMSWRWIQKTLRLAPRFFLCSYWRRVRKKLSVRYLIMSYRSISSLIF